MLRQRIVACSITLTALVLTGAAPPEPTAEEVRVFMRQLAEYVRDHGLSTWIVAGDALGSLIFSNHPRPGGGNAAAALRAGADRRHRPSERPQVYRGLPSACGTRVDPGGRLLRCGSSRHSSVFRILSMVI